MSTTRPELNVCYCATNGERCAKCGAECQCKKPKARVLRRFVMRGSKLVEVESRPARETRG